LVGVSDGKGVGRDRNAVRSQDRLPKMNKNINVEDRVWGQVMRLNLPMMQKASEE